MKLPAPFEYPSTPHIRRHGPHGYSKYGHYRNWLRDEFSFRCIYCLRRETWVTLPRDFEVDHLVPVSKRADLKLDYNNLGYACSECNGTKSAQRIPLPDAITYGRCLHVDENGVIHPKDKYGVALIEALDLDAPEYRAMRRRILRTIASAKHIPEILAWCLGYPDDLPNLSQERKPKGNNRPDGIRDSHFERRKREKLPAYY